jgi:ABC-type glycerol-3-phosphate transport system permease component
MPTVIFATTRGGPINRTTTFPVLIYRSSFKGSMNMGYTSAIGVLLPIYWLLNTSFEFQPGIFEMLPSLFPRTFTLKNYWPILFGDLASSISFLVYFKNSIIALTIMDDNAMRTLPVGIIQSFVGEFSITWGEMMAAYVVTSIPVMLIFVFLSKQLIGGLTAGAVKG